MAPDGGRRPGQGKEHSVKSGYDQPIVGSRVLADVLRHVQVQALLDQGIIPVAPNHQRREFAAQSKPVAIGTMCITTVKLSRKEGQDRNDTDREPPVWRSVDRGKPAQTHRSKEGDRQKQLQPSGRGGRT